jgi:hypothetical protein
MDHDLRDLPRVGEPRRGPGLPASVERYMPFPGDTLPRGGDSPVPTYTTLGSDGATAMAPIEPAMRVESVVGSHVMPPSLVFHTPPPVAPM